MLIEIMLYFMHLLFESHFSGEGYSFTLTLYHNTVFFVAVCYSRVLKVYTHLCSWQKLCIKRVIYNNEKGFKLGNFLVCILSPWAVFHTKKISVPENQTRMAKPLCSPPSHFKCHE